jgi:release factor glutamine methyltransferase
VITYGVLKRQALQRLAGAGFDTPELEVRWLLEAASNLSTTELFMHERHEAPFGLIEIYETYVQRRLDHEPLARITGWREFWGLRFGLNAATLEPRPDSETLVEAVLAKGRTYRRILDLGTGTGCLLAALLHELPEATGVGIDKSEMAVEQACINMKTLGLTARADIRQGDWAKGLTEPFDLIISNPPYIAESEMAGLAAELAHDPQLALVAGVDGLAAYRALIPEAARLLAPEGLLALEIGRGQAEAVTSIAKDSGFKYLKTQSDLGGHLRALLFTC